MNIDEASKDRIAFTQKEPIGLVLAISAFNHPFNLIIHQIILAHSIWLCGHCKTGRRYTFILYKNRRYAFTSRDYLKIGAILLCQKQSNLQPKLLQTLV